VSLIWVIWDGVVEWYEGMCMILFYFIYITTMKFNSRIGPAFQKMVYKSIASDR
jgi:Ca2+/Na+ antiporter